MKMKDDAFQSLFEYILAPLDGHSMINLGKVVVRLKQSDGEGWAAGEMLERALGFMVETQKYLKETDE